MISSDKIQKVFFILLRAGLWGHRVDDVSLFPLSDTEWKQVWLHAVRQSVRGLVYQGICQLEDKMLPGDLLMIHWTAEIDKIERRNRQMNAVLMRLIHAMKSRKVTPIVLKGQGIAQFYESPLSRECGDIDLFFADPSDEQSALDWVAEQGCLVQKESDGTHFYRIEGIEVEHHNRLFDLYASRVQTYVTQLTQHYGFAKSSIRDMADSAFCVLSPSLNLLSLNVHILKHVMGHGIGLRQFCDMARAYHVLQGEYDREELKECYMKCGIRKWSDLLHVFLVEQLGMPVHELPYRKNDCESSKVLLDRVMREGNFGKYGLERNIDTHSVWNRKVNTALAFVRNLRFSMNYAPWETLGLLNNLFVGNIKS